MSSLYTCYCIIVTWLIITGWMCIIASYGKPKVIFIRVYWLKGIIEWKCFCYLLKNITYLSGCLCKHKKLSLFILQQTRILYKFMLRWIDLIASQNSASFHKNNFLGFSFDIKNMTLHPVSAINFMNISKHSFEYSLSAQNF